MQELWEALTIELGAAFKNQYGDSQGSTFEHWVRELKEFTKEDLQRGFQSFKNSGSTYMSLNVFRSNCKVKAEDLGLPGFDESFRALIMAEWSNMPEAFRVLFTEHRFSLRQLTDTEARKRFKPIYDDAVKRIAAGEKFKIQKREQLYGPSGTTRKERYDGPKGSEAIKLMMKGLK